MAWMITKDRRRTAKFSLEGFGSFDVETKFSDCPELFVIEKNGQVVIEGVATEQTKAMEALIMCHIGKADLRYLPKEKETACG